MRCSQFNYRLQMTSYKIIIFPINIENKKNIIKLSGHTSVNNIYFGDGEVVDCVERYLRKKCNTIIKTY